MSDSSTPSRDISWAQAPYNVLCGFCMGTADVVPGVSGGTIALAMGIYHQLLNAISSASVEAIQALLRVKLSRVFELVHWRFLTTLLLGVGMAIVVMVKVVKLPELLHEQPKYVYSVFFGLVMASTLVLARRIPQWRPAHLGSLAAGAVLGFLIVNLVPMSTPETPAFLFFSGLIAICAMVLPGISGSFILLILGKYAYVMNALGDRDLSIIVPFALGCAVGITTFSRLVGWALARYHDPVLASLTGLLVGSLWRIWPYQTLTTIIVREKPRVVGAEPFLPTGLEPAVLGLFIAGLLLVAAVEVIAARRVVRG